MILVQHDRDFPITLAQHDFDMQSDKHAQALFRVRDAAHWVDHALLGDVHGVIHQIEKDFILALEMMVETAFAQLQRGRNVVHRGRVVAALLEKACCGMQDVLARVGGGFASHRQTGYTARNRNANRS
jgi:hypothetical protein